MSELEIHGWPPEGIDVQKQQAHVTDLPARTNGDLWAEARANNTDHEPPVEREWGVLAEVHDAGYIVEVYDAQGNLVDTDYANVGPNVWVRLHAWYPWVGL